MTTVASTVVLGTTERGASMVLDLAELNTSGLFVTGNTGSGKSGALRKFVEETYGRGQQLVLDSEGEFSTLAAAFEFVVLGGRSPSVPPLPTAPAHVRALAEKVYELGVSAIFDMSRLELTAQQAFVRDFVDATLGAAMHLQPEERHFAYLVIDELQLFAPQQSTVASSAKIIDLSNRGRRNGLVPVFATQRLSYVDKGAVAMIQNKLIGKTTYSGDMTRAAEEMPLDRLQRDRLRALERRQFYAYGPALSSEPAQFTVGDVKTHMPRTSDRTTYDPPSPSPEVLAALASLGAVEGIPPESEGAPPGKPVGRSSRGRAPKPGRIEPSVTDTGDVANPGPTSAAPACGHEAELSELNERLVQYAAHGVAWAKEKEALRAELEAERARTNTLRSAIDDAMAAYARGENDARSAKQDRAADEGTGIDASDGPSHRRNVGTRRAVQPGARVEDIREQHDRGGAGMGSLPGSERLDSANRAGRSYRDARGALAARSPKLAASARRDTEDMKDAEVEAMLDKMLSARLAGGASVVVVAPAEALRHEYQQRAVDYVMQRAESLGDDSRDILRWMLAHFEDGTVASRPASAIAQAVTSYREGRIPDKFSNALRALVDAKLVEMSGRGGSQAYRPRVREWIRAELTVHRATIEEEEATYQAFLAKIAGAS